MKPNVALGRALGILQRFSQVSLSSKLFALASHPPYSKDSQSPLWWFSVTRFDYNGAEKSHDLLKIQDLSLVEILFVKKIPLQDLLSSLNAVISTNERH